MKNHLELFSGTHSFGKVSSVMGYNVVSLDRDLGATCPFSGYISKTHIKEDIMTWNYKDYPIQDFDLITASPVCLWWSSLRNTWIGRKLKSHGDKVITKEILEEDIDKFGKPMVDKIFEIIEHFKPKNWIVENPKTGKMKYYIAEKYPQYNNFNDYSYCKFSNWGYMKNTRFWNNIPNLECRLCKRDCENMIFHKDQKIHRGRMGIGKTIINEEGKIIRCGTKALREKYKDFENIKVVKHKNNISDVGGGSNRLERYRIPLPLIKNMLEKI